MDLASEKIIKKPTKRFGRRLKWGMAILRPTL